MTSIGRLLKSEAAAGIILLFAAILAMLAANSFLQDAYDAFLHSTLSISINDVTLTKSAHHWINDGLMVIFFLLVGMEIKREVLEGHLSSRAQAMLPCVAAIGGVVVPALIYLSINGSNPNTAHGWAIASATDIAFAVGILALFGKKLPTSLKVFLVAVAVIDDLMAILIIAFFYGGELNGQALLWAAIALAILFLLNLLRVRYLSFYLFFGVLLWFAILKSGIHPTIAGVLLGLTIPMHVDGKHGKSMLKQFEHDLHPFVNYIILPLFAFANSGINLEGITFSVMADPVPLGIILGLFFGKQFGLFGACALMIKSGLAKLPHNTNWQQLYGVCMIGGIGFTMSLFIGTLAFSDAHLQLEMRVGVMVGSLLSGVTGYFFLRHALKETMKNNR